MQGCYGLIALTKEDDNYYLAMIAKEPKEGESIWGTKGADKQSGKEFERIPFTQSKVTFRLKANFQDNIDEVEFYYKEAKSWVKLGITVKLYFKLDHFTGCRLGLFMYSTKTVGGSVSFMDFCYSVKEEF